ncbi:MAG TPA: His/Gly/Thr/Pro-type tRNA ligase C-terminal domain-containing protein, partial [Candidatus Nanoarchaeia archaeon]|nr:His/Gly/Thr/Pro-type tRNA ligase C-terminal domain-containing protein [Candidatus Nanoarchaeia archaeon]
TLSDAGEDVIHVAPDFGIAINKEIIDQKEAFDDIEIPKEKFEPKSSIEVGNIFNLGTRFSEALGLTFLDKDGKPKPVIMGSYGIGPARVMGTIVEALSDTKGIVWPEAVAPFKVHLIEVQGSPETKTAATNLYETLTKLGVETLYDDRDARAGEKFADSDLIGIPWRVVVSDKTLTAGGVELKKRTEDTTKIISEKELISSLTGHDQIPR